MWLDIVLAISCAGCGAMCGWVMHAFAPDPEIEAAGQTGSTDDSAETGPDPEPAPGPSATVDDSFAEVTRTLKTHAKSMSDDVDAHQERVELINLKLLDDRDTNPATIAEIVGQILDANTQMQAQLSAVQDQLHRQTLELESAEHRAQTDALTLIPNRGAFDQHLQQRIDIGPRIDFDSPHAGVLALLDIDHFKKFNDDHGHLAGDEVLRAVAGQLHHRLSDHGIVARYGGEEFAVILDGCTIDEAAAIVEPIRGGITDRGIFFEDKLLSVTASMGLTEFTADMDASKWIENADKGLYASKEAGRNCGHKWVDETPIRLGQPATATSPTELSDASNPSELSDRSDRSDPSHLSHQRDPSDPSAPSHLSHPPDRSAPSHPPDPSDPPDPPDLSTTAEPANDPDSDPTGEIPVESPESASAADALSKLPDFDRMRGTVTEIRQRAGDDVELAMIAVRLTAESPQPAILQLLPMIRAKLRNVDRLGTIDPLTLLICLPSIDSRAAATRATQMVQSAISVGLDDANRPSTAMVRIGGGQTFEAVVKELQRKLG